MAAETLGAILFIIGVVMLISEVVTPGFFVAIPGTVMLVLGIIGYFVPEILTSAWTPVIVFVVGVPTFIATIYFYRRFGAPQPPTTTMGDSLKGKTALVTRDIEPDSIKGKVKVSNRIWSATSETDIPVGKKVVILKSEGVHLIVKEKQME